jgi:uncharacterized protein (DUF433 family)
VSALDETGDMSGTPIQRTVDAASAPRLSVTAPNSPFNWRPAGADLAAPEETKMPDAPTPKTTAEPAARNVQVRVLEVIGAASKAVTRTEIAKALPDLNSTQLSNALFNASGNSRAQRSANNAWSLTPGGRAFLKQRSADAAGTAPPHTTGKAARAPRTKATNTKPAARAESRRPHRKPKRVPVDDIVVSDKPPPPPSMPRTFRCAVYSDGGFMLHKGDARIELDADEHAGMLRYLERMAEEQVATA